MEAAEVEAAGELRTLVQVHIQVLQPREQVVEVVVVVAEVELLQHQEVQDESQPVVQGEGEACRYTIINTDHG